jgi:AAA+ ATPase superfamily predicted ATPase
MPDTPVNAFDVPFLFLFFYTLIIGIYLLFIIINILKRHLITYTLPVFQQKREKNKKKEIILFIFL